MTFLKIVQKYKTFYEKENMFFDKFLKLVREAKVNWSCYDNIFKMLSLIPYTNSQSFT